MLKEIVLDGDLSEDFLILVVGERTGGWFRDDVVVPLLFLVAVRVRTFINVSTVQIVCEVLNSQRVIDKSAEPFCVDRCLAIGELGRVVPS